MKKQVIAMIENMVGPEQPYYFDTPLRVRSSPHMPGLNIDGVVIYKGRLFIFDLDWVEVEGDNPWSQLIVNSLYQRLSIISKQLIKN